MIPRSPVVEGREDEEVALGANQPDLQTLPTIYFRDHEGRKALSAWRLEDDAEREEFLRTGVVYVSQIIGDGAPRPILPSVFPPVIPEADPAADAAEGSRIQPVMFEFRLVPLDRESGNPKGTVESAARFYVDLTTLALNFNAVGGETADPTEIIDRQLDTLARVLANAYGADVFFRLYDGTPGGWKVTEGRLDNGAHARRTLRPGALFYPEVDVAALDVGGAATVAEAIQMMKTLRDRFEPPLYLLSFSPVESPGDLASLGEVVTSKPCGSVPEVVAHFRAMLRPRGDYCLLICNEPGDPSKAGSFLLDLRLFEKARSN